MHNLNLDWIIKIAKDFLDQYTHIQQLISDGETSLQTLTTDGLESLQNETNNGLEELENKKTELEGLLNQWYNTHSTDIANQLQSALNDIASILATSINTFDIHADAKEQEILDALPLDYTDLAYLVERIIDTNPLSLNKLNPAGDGLALNSTPGEIVGTSTPYDFATENGSCVCKTLTPVKNGDTVYVKCKNDYRNVFGLFFYDTDKKFLRRVNSEPQVSVTADGYVMLMAFDCSDSATYNAREYYLNVNTNYSYTPYGLNKSEYDIEKLKSEQLTKTFVPLYSLNILDGYYQADNNFNFVSDASKTFQAVKVSVKPGEKYKITCRVRPVTQFPIAYFLTADNHLISTTGAVSDITTFRGYPITIPANCYYMICHTDNGAGTVTTNVTLTVEKEMVIDKADAPLAGQKVLVIGDSFSVYASRWRTEFYKRTKAVELACISRGGAHLCDYADTVLDGNYYTEIPGSERNNTIDNMITYLDLNRPNASPNIIIIQAYINDAPTREQLTTYSNQINNGWSAPWINISDVDRTITEGAMRWQVSKLRTIYPYSQIIYISPIETAYYDVEYMKLKDDKMSGMVQRLSCDIVHGIKCGITAEFETVGSNGRFLEDGLHPNATGGIVLGRYIAQHIANLFADRLSRNI